MNRKPIQDLATFFRPQTVISPMQIADHSWVIFHALEPTALLSFSQNPMANFSQSLNTVPAFPN